MEIIGLGILYKYKKAHPICCNAIKSWIKEVEKAEWENFISIKERYVSASNIGDKIVMFNIKGNHFRLAVRVFYQRKIVIILRMGTHKDYDKWKF